MVFNFIINSVSFLYLIFLCCIEPFGLIFITFLFFIRLHLFRLLLSQSIYEYYHCSTYFNFYKLFLIILNIFLIPVFSWPFILIFLDLKVYVSIYLHFLYSTVYSRHWFLEDFIEIVFICIFYYILYRNRVFLKKEYTELWEICKLHIFPYFRRKFKLILMFLSKSKVFQYLSKIFAKIFAYFEKHYKLFVIVFSRSRLVQNILYKFSFIKPFLSSFIKKFSLLLKSLKSWFKFKK